MVQPRGSTLFGKIVVASTAKGICYLGFEDVEGQGLSDLRSRFPAASFCHTLDPLQQKLLTFFDHLSWPEEVRLHLQATDFQLKVWQALLTIPMGSLQSYGTIARRVDVPGASRAVGSAIGRNPVAVLIPCHRVIRASGEVGGYYWGDTRKSAIIGWEASKRETEHGSF